MYNNIVNIFKLGLHQVPRSKEMSGLRNSFAGLHPETTGRNERPAPGKCPRILVAYIFLNKNILKRFSSRSTSCGSCGGQESAVLLVLLFLCCFPVLPSLIAIHVK